MEKHVDGGGIRDAFYSGLADDYLQQEKEEESFLYRAFWRENVAGLLKMLDEVTLHGEKIFPGLLEKLDENFRQLPENKSLLPEDRPRAKGRLDFHNFVHQLDPECEPWLKGQLKKFMEEHKHLLEELMCEHRQHPGELTGEQKQQAGCLPLKKRERWDFWRELWLNDAYYEAGLITDTDYYLWLAECLTAHSAYYTDKNIWVEDGHTWLYVLLLAGLSDTELDPCKMWGKELQGNDLEDDPENNLDKVEVEECLTELTRLVKDARDTRGAREARWRLNNLERVSIHFKRKDPKNISGDGKQAAEKKDRKYVQKYINARTKVQVGRDLAALAKMMREEKDKGGREIAFRLQGLKYPDVINEDSVGWVEYLPWLTAQLERMALHGNIKTWLQDSGYTIGKKDKIKAEDEEYEYELKKSPKGARKQDFTMRLFEEYYDSTGSRGMESHSTESRGFNLVGQGTETVSGSLKLDILGFCVLEPDKHEALRAAMEKSKKTKFYIPLAVDMRSGCIFFLAGKDNYKNLYKDTIFKKMKEDKAAYNEKAKKFNCCFDYLRLDEDILECPEYVGEGTAFRLAPTFHLNAGRKAEDVLSEFKRYCVYGEAGRKPRQIARKFNTQAPKGIPKEFYAVFEKSYSQEKPNPK